jgi:hypothetical protein
MKMDVNKIRYEQVQKPWYQQIQDSIHVRPDLPNENVYIYDPNFDMLQVKNMHTQNTILFKINSNPNIYPNPYIQCTFTRVGYKHEQTTTLTDVCWNGKQYYEFLSGHPVHEEACDPCCCRHNPCCCTRNPCHCDDKDLCNLLACYCLAHMLLN